MGPVWRYESSGRGGWVVLSCRLACRIEETWRLWQKFLDDYSRFEDWLKSAERTAACPNSSEVLYTVAKEELKRFEVRPSPAPCGWGPSLRQARTSGDGVLRGVSPRLPARGPPQGPAGVPLSRASAEQVGEPCRPFLWWSGPGGLACGPRP